MANGKQYIPIISKPVLHDHEAFLKKALKRKEFSKAYERKKKIEKIKSMKGKLKFDMTADEIRHRER